HELTLANNRAAVVVNGVRDRLRVLLVTGEPHAGERAGGKSLKPKPPAVFANSTIWRPRENPAGRPIGNCSSFAFRARALSAAPESRAGRRAGGAGAARSSRVFITALR